MNPFLRCALTTATLALVACGGKVGPAADADVEHDAAPTRDAGTRSAEASLDGGTPGHEAGLPDGACRTSSDCKSDFESCVGPASQAESCICERVPSCTTDSQCDAGTVCTMEPGATSCSGSGPWCLPPCQSDGDCYYWQGCSEGHCNALPCSACPSYLSCSAGICGPKSCATDTDCPGGHCVDETCFGTFGVCAGECG